jgi:hypothetical protein
LMTTIKLECSMIPLFFWWKQDIITHDKQATRDFFDVTRMQWASKRQLVCNKWIVVIAIVEMVEACWSA